MELPELKKTRKLDAIIDVARIIASNPIEFGGFKLVNSSMVEKIGEKEYVTWEFEYMASPDENKKHMLGVYYDNEEDKAYFGKEKVGHHPHDLEMIQDILEYFIRRIPRERKRWFTSKVEECANPDSLLEKHKDFYSEHERTQLQRYIRMRPVLARIFEKARELEFEKRQEEVTAGAAPYFQQMLKEQQENPEAAHEIGEKYSKEFEKIDAEYSISDPDDAVKTFCIEYVGQRRQILGERDANIEACLKGNVTADNAKEQISLLNDNLQRLYGCYKNKWPELRKRMGIDVAKRFPKEFSELVAGDMAEW